MPAADYRLGGKQSKKRPPRKVAPVLAQSLAQERQYASQGKAVQKAASPPRPQRLKAGIPKLESAPGRKAARQAERKQARAEPKINLPYFPKLDHPTDEQRGAVIEGTARSARAQASPEQIRRKRLYGSKTERQRLNRGAGARKTAVRDINVKAALRALGHPDAKPAPGRTGELAAMGAEMADAQHPRASPGKPHRKISAAGVNIDVTALGRGLAAAAAQHVTSGHGAPLKNLPVLAKNTGKDALALPVGAVKGIYEAGAAGVEAAQGDTKRAKRIIGSLDEGALGRLLIHADVPGAEKAFREHPLFSALDVAGAYSVAGRGAGAVARSGADRKSVV